MQRQLLVLKTIILALEEVANTHKPLTEATIVPLAVDYGTRYRVHASEIKPLLTPLLAALRPDPPA
jgi:hypothetical protein